MKILDYFQHPKFGGIVSIAHPKFENLSNDEIQEIIGEKIVILEADSQSKKSVKVSRIDIATSLIGQKNINICLSDSIKLSDLKPNSELLLLSEADTTQLADTVEPLPRI